MVLGDDIGFVFCASLACAPNRTPQNPAVKFADCREFFILGRDFIALGI